MSDYPSIVLGDSGESVVFLQGALDSFCSQSGIAAPEWTGNFDEPTLQVLQEFQRWNGMEETTVVGPDTWTALHRVHQGEEIYFPPDDVSTAASDAANTGIAGSPASHSELDSSYSGRPDGVIAPDDETPAVTDEGGIANLTDLEQDMRDVLIEWQQAAQDGVTLFATTTLSERLDELESGSWEKFLVGLLGNVIWATAAFSTFGTAFAISFAGVLVNAAPSVPSKSKSALPEIQEEMINYIQTVYAQLNAQLRGKAQHLLTEYPDITRYRALASFVEHSFKPDVSAVDGSYHTRPSLSQQTITDLYNRMATDQLDIAELVSSDPRLVVYMATYVGYDPDARQPLATTDEQRTILYGWKVEGTEDDADAGKTLLHYYGQDLAISWHSAPIPKTVHHVWYEWFAHREQLWNQGVDTHEYDAENALISSHSTSAAEDMPRNVMQELNVTPLTPELLGRIPAFGVD